MRLRTLNNNSKTDKPILTFSSEFIEEFKTEVSNFTLKLADIENSKIFSDFEDKLKDETEARITEITNQIEQDNLKEFIENNFTIGDDYSFPELMDIISEGELRYSASIPPGYMDAKEKQSIQVYGDLIIWKQILKYAQSHSNQLYLFQTILKRIGMKL